MLVRITLSNGSVLEYSGIREVKPLDNGIFELTDSRGTIIIVPPQHVAVMQMIGGAQSTNGVYVF